MWVVGDGEIVGERCVPTTSLGTALVTLPVGVVFGVELPVGVVFAVELPVGVVLGVELPVGFVFPEESELGVEVPAVGAVMFPVLPVGLTSRLSERKRKVDVKCQNSAAAVPLRICISNEQKQLFLRTMHTPLARFSF